MLAAVGFRYDIHADCWIDGEHGRVINRETVAAPRYGLARALDHGKVDAARS